ncbi:MAG: FG-GAP repeat domain-containing protein [Acidimicrobiales bacterium]
MRTVPTRQRQPSKLGPFRRAFLAAATTAAVAVVAVAVVPAAVVPAAGTARLAAASSGRHDTLEAPLWVAPLGRVEFSSPTFARIDGVEAVVAASLNGTLYVRNAANGALLPGWPRRVVIKGSRTTWVDSSPAVAYLDGPRRPPTIVIGAGSLFQRSPAANGGVIAFRVNGSLRWVFHTKATFPQSGPASAGFDNSVFATPAIGDITGNGHDDIVFGSYDHYLYALTAAGRLVPGFPVQRADTIWSSAALADVTHTGRDDIFVGGDASGFENQAGRPCHGGWMTDYRYSTRRRAPKLVWERCLGQTVWSSPAVGVINRGRANPRGRPAVVVGTSYFGGYASRPATDEVFAFYADNGRTVPGWPARAKGPTFGSPAIAPAIAGRAPLVISTSCARCLDGPSVVSAWTGSGRRVWSKVINEKTEMLGSPSVANVTGSGPNDVLLGNAAGVYVLNAATGALVDGTGSTPLEQGCRTDGTPAVSQITTASRQRPASGWVMVFSCTEGASGRLVAYGLPAPPDSVPPWPEWRANAQRTGVAATFAPRLGA